MLPTFAVVGTLLILLYIYARKEVIKYPVNKICPRCNGRSNYLTNHGDCQTCGEHDEPV